MRGSLKKPICRAAARAGALKNQFAGQSHAREPQKTNLPDNRTRGSLKKPICRAAARAGASKNQFAGQPHAREPQKTNLSVSRTRGSPENCLFVEHGFVVCLLFCLREQRYSRFLKVWV
jgi:hypothetical protein